MSPSPEDIQRIKTTSPSVLRAKGNILVETKNLRGFLSVSELREALVALAQNHYLSYQYIMNNFGANDHDALEEVFRAESIGIFIKADSAASTFKLFWHLNPELSDKEIRAYVYPKIARRQRVKIKKYAEEVRSKKIYSHRSRLRRMNDARGESNRIVRTVEKRRNYETLTGEKSLKKYGEKDDVTWSKKTSLKLERSIRDGSIRREHEEFDDI